MAKSAGGGGRVGRRGIGSLTPQSRTMLSSFHNTSSAGIDVRQVPGLTRGRTITKKGAESFNQLVTGGFIAPTARIGSSGLPTYRLTPRGQRALR